MSMMGVDITISSICLAKGTWLASERIVFISGRRIGRTDLLGHEKLSAGRRGAKESPRADATIKIAATYYRVAAIPQLKPSSAIIRERGGPRRGHAAVGRLGRAHHRR